ncbi:Conserved_hypothetical protein [Hexamita inflata]|uniref:Uncharacterized protein n=1 Tax=Hexamita inflata TaxID=28002 RepID=A0ABP1GHJ8_9EUKA
MFVPESLVALAAEVRLTYIGVSKTNDHSRELTESQLTKKKNIMYFYQFHYVYKYNKNRYHSLLMNNEQHDKRALDKYQANITNGVLLISGPGIQSIQFVDQLQINSLRVIFSNDILFDRVPTKITSLNIINCTSINLTGIEQMKQLTNLRLYYNYHEQINFVSTLINLTNLNLGANKIKDLSPIKDLIALKDINLIRNNIEDISPLKDLLDLTEINISHNKIQDINPIRTLIKTESLNLDFNIIVDVNPLKYLKQLKKLHLKHNQIITVKPLQLLEKLTECDVNQNMIQDLFNLPKVHQADENFFFNLFDEDGEQIQLIPTKQQLHFSNITNVVNDQQNLLEQEANCTNTIQLSFILMKTKIRQLLTKTEDSYVCWSSCLAQMFETIVYDYCQ